MALPPQTLNGIAACAGAGGLELGIKLLLPQYSTVCWIERDAYAATTLVARMADKALAAAPIWSDITTFNGSDWRGKVDILSAGYPCQPFSASGLRRGAKDPRHLWPHVRRILAECEAPVLFAENVQGHVTLGLEQVYTDLQNMGYAVQAGIFSAAEVGASHVRKRLFILAYSSHAAIGNIAKSYTDKWQTNYGQGPLSAGAAFVRRDMDDTVSNGPRPEPFIFPPDPSEFNAWDAWNATRPGLQPALVGADDGLAYKLERYKLTGNGVVPLVAAYALATLANTALHKPKN